MALHRVNSIVPLALLVTAAEGEGMDGPSLWDRIRGAIIRIATSISYAWLLLILSLPFVVFVYLKSTVTPHSERIEGAKGWGGLIIDYASLQWWAIFSSVLFFGALGSTVSFFSRQDLSPREISRTRTLVGTQLFGSVFATLLFLAFLGGLVQGSLFPQFVNLSWFSLVFLPADWARLMVWSFIAGFSERFVPDLLNNLLLRGARDEDREPEKSADDGGGRPPKEGRDRR